MGPKTLVAERDFFRQPLREQINLGHALVRLAELIWDRLDSTMAASFVSQRGRPATPTRLVAGLLYLQHTFDLSDEEVVWQWVENPYWQIFTGGIDTRTQALPAPIPARRASSAIAGCTPLRTSRCCCTSSVLICLAASDSRSSSRSISVRRAGSSCGACCVH